jgi:hypothetical protein
MSYQEKRALVFLISILLIFGLYCLYVFHRYHDRILSNPNDLRFWGKTVLILIPVSVVANIFSIIVFIIINKIITNEDVPVFSDERDKLIELKAIRISHWVFMVGFFLSMTSQVIGMQAYIMLITLVVSGFVAACASEITKIHLYRKGG